MARDKAMGWLGTEKSLTKGLIDWLNEKIDPETGYWAHDKSFNGTNGYFKIIVIYNAWGYAYPAIEKAIDSVLAGILGDQPSLYNICEVYNLWSALISSKQNVLQCYPESEQAELLAKYLIEKNKSRHLLLLKPSLSETLSSLKDVSEIRFVNKDGTMAESTSDALIKKIMDTLKKESPAANYEVEKIVTWDDVSNNSIMQSYFVYDLTMFLNKHFPVKRKKDALVSTKEVELILYLMKLFGLSTVELTNKRYWQLMKTCKDVDKQIKEHRLLINHEGAIIPLYLIPYSVWNNSKIEWNDENTSKFDAGDSFAIKL